VGEEPSGAVFNEPIFDGRGRPHNPMVNAGAIMVSTLLVNEGLTIHDFQNFYMRASSTEDAEIDIPLYKDEALTGNTNHALRSLMLANRAYPKKSTYEETKQLADNGLDFYFKQCSMLVDVGSMARFGAMLANGGVNPSTGERIVSPSTVKATVTLMQTCGMYNGAGKFTKDHGVPAKSGVSGGLLTVIPGIGAVATWSPPLNEEGNCVRGIGMIEKLSALYSNINLFHKDPSMLDMTRKPYQTTLMTIIAGCNAASSGDLETITRLYNLGLNLDRGDYDNRTPLHLAASGNHLDVVAFLLETGAQVNVVDRWGCTPLDDATEKSVINYLAKFGAHHGKKQKNKRNMPPVTVTDDDFRLFYAAHDNNVHLM
jgi:glutaminase